MKKLQYIIEDSTIAALLGEQNFTNKEAAVLELVKNAYDAGATQLTIAFDNDSITICDNGSGMSEEDIKQKWMHVGKSDKEYHTLDINHEERILAGSKGIGRFALARLGTSAQVFSLKQGFTPIVWETNWNYSTVSEAPNSSVGTKIVIYGLRDKWTEKAINGLSDFLSKTYNDDKMLIFIKSPTISIQTQKYFVDVRTGHNCKSIIHFSYDNTTRSLKTTVSSDEFEDAAQTYCPGIDIHSFASDRDMFDELKSAGWDLTEEELAAILQQLGPFCGDLYFNLSSTSAEKEKFLYKYSSLVDAVDSGVILYRNAFSISAYEGKKDWLALNKRARKSPAAATHPTGAWRVRENQISGKIEIDKKQNNYLRDLSNRQGLEENIHYELFVEIILTSLKEFERYRQGIIRSIDIKNAQEKKETVKPISDRVLASPTTVLGFSKKEAQQLAQEIKAYQKEQSDYKKGIEDTEQRYKYDVRILNVLATTGLKASSLAHEMKNDRNFVDNVNENIIAALQEYGVWDLLSSTEKTQKSYKNVPYLLKRNGEISQKLVAFMNTMLQEIEKRKFKPSWISIADVLNQEKRNWERDYAWLSVSVVLEEDICFYLSEDVLRVITDNLILNSVQQNKNRNELNVTITAKASASELFISYCDDGVGLDKKYLDNPRKILEVHETTRKDGHGLGMWIVNNTITMQGGKITTIGSENGFQFAFSIEGSRQ